MQPSKIRENLSDRHIALALGLLLLAVYLTTAALRFRSIDEVATFTVARNLSGRGSVDGDILYWRESIMGRGSVVAEGSDGQTYVVKDVGPSLLATPLVWLARWLPISPVRAALLVSPIVTALTGGLLYQVAREWGYNRTTGVLGSLTFGLASLAWPYAQTLFGQPLAALGLLIALWGITKARRESDWRAALIGGLGLGLAGLSAVPTWVTLPAYALYLLPWEKLQRGRWRSVLRSALPLLVAFGASAALIALSQAAYNTLRFGSPTQTGYQQVGVASIRLAYFMTGSFGQLLSTPRGLIWYAPFVLLVPFGLLLGWKSGRRRPLLLAATQVLLIFSLYSSYLIWSAGLNWGPRFLVVAMPTLTLLTIPLFDRLTKPAPLWARLVAGVILLLSITTQLLTSLFQPGSEGQINETLFNLFLVNPPHGLISSDPILTDLSLLPLVRLIDAVQHGQWDVLWRAHGTTDWPLLIAQIAVLALASLWLIMLLRGKLGSILSRAVALQIGLSIAVAGFMLLRFPQAHTRFSPQSSQPDQATVAADLNGLYTSVSSQVGPDEAIVTVLPESYLSWIDRIDGSIPDTGFTFESVLRQASQRKLETIAQQNQRVWLVSEGTGGANPDNGVEQWLAQRGYAGSGMSFGGYRLVPYTFSTGQVALQPVGQSFGENSEIELISYQSQLVEGESGDWLNVRLRWQATQQLTDDYTVFVHLLTTDWEGRGGHDGWPVAGYAPTTTWTLGEAVDDRHVILLPEGLQPGGYRLVVGLYTGPGVQPLLLADGSSHQLVLDEFQITAR